MKPQRDEILIEKTIHPISKKPQRGEILFSRCRSAGIYKYFIPTEFLIAAIFL